MQIELDELTLITFNKENKKHLEFFKKILGGLENRFQGILPNLMRNSSSFFNRGYLVSDNDVLIGYIDISSYNEDEQSVYLRASVDSSTRGKVYGKLILKEVTEYIFSNYSNVVSIRLKIEDDNTYSIKTALSCGYLNVPNTQIYVIFNPNINIKNKIKF